MKSKAPLALMEQLVMVLVFALAAALCLQVFVLSDRMSQRSEARDHAVVQVQNVAETLKGCDGDLSESAARLGGIADEESLQIGYDTDWRPVPVAESIYLVQAVRTEEEDPMLGGAQVFAQTVDGDVLFQVNVCWQEVAAHA